MGLLVLSTERPSVGNLFTDTMAATRASLSAAPVLLVLIFGASLAINAITPLTKDNTDGSAWLPAILLYLGGMLLSISTYAAFARAVELRTREETVDSGEVLRSALETLFPVAATSLLVGLIAFVGTLLLIVPGIMATCALYVAIPACVLERLSAPEALQRSRSLTKGYRMTLFGMILVAGLAMLPIIGITIAVGAAAPALAFPLLVLQSTVLTPFTSAMAAVIFLRLRSAKGLDPVGVIAEKFD
ncbi:MAG: hypothetical protein HZA61_12325 [Candidatus Eisenbacteria bacterium]|uniref:Glycerophosphoryl diester phosphodiesterase membrane domain-containing protein n=1 Tax=Eiseniibacteriota bacterium TaxID=2212470 RepID=A0A933SCY8_UNCEI|nr:hypothetical protein [Candidatus Eisenbacteria bacterium]